MAATTLRQVDTGLTTSVMNAPCSRVTGKSAPRASLARRSHLDIDADQLPLAFRSEEVELVSDASRRGVEIAAQHQTPAAVDFRFAGGDDRLGGDEVEIDMLIGERFETLLQFLGGDLVAKRLG